MCKKTDSLTTAMLLVIAATVLLGGGYLYGRASAAPQVASSNVSKGVVEQEFDRLNAVCNQVGQTAEIQKACAYRKTTR